jgi:hypothetical protein
VPYAAVSRFYDPSVQFLLQFEPSPEPADGEAGVEPTRAEAPAPPPVASAEGEEPKVVSLDQFRKK